MKSLLVTSCTARKSSTPGLVRASERYLGPTFRASIEDARRTRSDLALISAEFGFISQDTMVPNYDTVLKGSIPTRDEAKHHRVVPTNDKRLQALVGGPLIESILEHQDVVIFLPSHYLMVVENAVNLYVSHCRFRVMVKRPSNQLFSQAVLTGNRSIVPSRKYQDVLDNPVRCVRCAEELQNSDEVQLRRGRLIHLECVLRRSFEDSM